MNELALFAGAGGGLLASKLLGWHTVCYVEWNGYAVDVLKARIKDGYLDDAPIWDDCFTFDGHPWAGLVDIITAGFPCQPFSVAGRALAEADPRNGWPPIKRILGEIQPPYVWLENVPGLVSKPYIRRIFGDLAELGYDAEWGIVSAASVGAPHLRKRLWVFAHPAGIQEHIQLFAWQDRLQPAWNGTLQSLADPNSSRSSQRPVIGGECQGTPDPLCIGLEEQRNKQNEYIPPVQGWWSVEPGLGRVANGVANRVDRLTAIGNGQVPAVARAAWHLLTERIGDIP